MITSLTFLRSLKSEIIERYKILRYYRFPMRTIDWRTMGSFLVRDDTDSYLEKKLWTHTKNMSDSVQKELASKLHRIKLLQDTNNTLTSSASDILVISYSIPDPNATSSEFRLFQILNILLKSDCKINLVYCSSKKNDEKTKLKYCGSIQFYNCSLNLQSYLQKIKEFTNKAIWITELWRIEYVEFLLALCTELKKLNCHKKLIVDTVDFHYKEFYRKYETSHNDVDLREAQKFLSIETLLYPLADTVVTVSHDEKVDIHRAIQGIPRIEVIPNIHEVSLKIRPYEKRNHICFVGNFANKHNIDAVYYFLDNIFGHILKISPESEFHLLGYYSDKLNIEAKYRHVKKIGGLKYLDNALSFYRLFVCPMTYGAGMKGKVGGAIAAGIPVVTTRIGAEGFSFKDGVDCFITDDPFDFAEKCIRCLNDPVLWNSMSINARLKIAENFSPAIIGAKIMQIVA